MAEKKPGNAEMDPGRPEANAPLLTNADTEHTHEGTDTAHSHAPGEHITDAGDAMHRQGARMTKSPMHAPVVVRGGVGVPEEALAGLVKIGDPTPTEVSGEGEGQQGVKGPQGQPFHEMPGFQATRHDATPMDAEDVRRAFSMSPQERMAQAMVDQYEAQQNPLTETVPGGRYIREDGKAVDAMGRILDE